MLDMFGPTYQDLTLSNIAHAANALAIAQVLIDKGIITEDEFVAAQAKMLVACEQEMTRKNDEAARQAMEDNPGVALLAKLFKP